MILLPLDKSEYIPKTGNDDKFTYQFVELYDYYVVKWGINQTAVLKDGESMQIRNKATGTGFPTQLKVDRGKLYVIE